MKFRVIIICLLITTGLSGQSVNFDQYRTIVPMGSIPKDFTEKSFVKVASEVKSIANSSVTARRTKSKFYLESTFSIDDFLTGGSVLFNDPVSIYLQAVLNEIARPYPHLKDKVRIYAVKSSVVNAFTTNNGIIFVNLGLIARLQNEAQLAFVLAHEIVHFEKQHILNAYITSLEIDRGNGTYRNIPVDGKHFAKSSYSKDLESEADRLGSEIFLRSRYSADSVGGIFDILRHAERPYELRKFDRRIFESGRYVFHDSLLEFKPFKVSVEENYDDSKSSHPNIRKRREAVQTKIGAKKEGKSFIVSFRDFFEARKISQFELCRMHLLDHEYMEALNVSLDLLQEEPDSDYLHESIAKALYGISKSRSYKDFEIKKEQWQGESGKLSALIHKLSDYETYVLAIRYLYQCYESDPHNAGLELMLKDLIHTFGATENMTSKFARPGDKNNDESPVPYTLFAFQRFKDQKKFFAFFDETLRKARKGIDQPKQLWGRHLEMQEASDISKIVVVNPKYRKIDRRKKQRTRHIEAEKVVIDMNEKIHASAGRLDLQSEILNPNTLTRTEVRTMQSNSVLTDWLQEQFRSGDHRMVSPIHNEMLEIARTHRTEHFLWIGCTSVIQKKRAKGVAVASALILPSISPFSAAYLVTPRGRTFYFALLFNVRTQQLELSDLRMISMKDSPSLLESNLYYTLFRVKDLMQ
jgi:beta-barrel assembly-enhancing protease